MPPRKRERNRAAATIPAAEIDDLLTRQEAASLLRVTVRTMREMAAKQTGPRFLKIGSNRQSRVRYRRKDVQEWLASRAHLVG